MGWAKEAHIQSMRHAFMMDFENACLQNWSGPHPKGRDRYLHPEWGEMMRQQCEAHSDVTFEEYCDWVRGGSDDEWFVQED